MQYSILKMVFWTQNTFTFRPRYLLVKEFFTVYFF